MELSARERDRMAVLRQVDEGMLAAATGAARLGENRRAIIACLKRHGRPLARLCGPRRADPALRPTEERWIPFWNERFAVAPADPLDAHRPLAPDADAPIIFTLALRSAGRRFLAWRLRPSSKGLKHVATTTTNGQPDVNPTIGTATRPASLRRRSASQTVQPSELDESRRFPWSASQQSTR